MEALSRELVDCARYGEHDDMQALLDQNADVNFAVFSGNTALHMASANGHGGCVDLLITAGAKHLDNDSGNTPLHWAVQNKHIDLVKTLLKAFADADVLSKNSFGKSVLTEAFGAGDEKVTQLLLEHKSAAELDKGNTADDSVEPGAEGAGTGESLEAAAAGDGDGGESSQPSDGATESKGGKTGGKGGCESSGGGKTGETGPATQAAATAPAKAADAKIVQTYTYDLDFDGNGITGPNLKVREVATDWTGDVFSGATTAAGDTTGMQVWATALVFARWIVALQADSATAFDGSAVIELGAGAGVPGLAALFYSTAAKVTLTDMFKLTMNNLRFNVASNLKASDARSYEHVEVVSLDWAQLDPATAGSFDVVLGSDLVYDDGAVDLLIGVVDHLLSPSGVFYLAAGGRRKGVTKLIADLPGRGFCVSSMNAPAAYLANPLSSGDENELELHFNELGENTFTLHKITRASSPTN